MSDLYVESGAEFSDCRKFRFALWRIWDKSLPLVMFIGLNPSTANESESDPTIKSVIRIAKHNGFGGVYMMNCFPFVSTDPRKLEDEYLSLQYGINEVRLSEIARKCTDVVFAWGSFGIVKDLAVDLDMISMFPNAKAIHVNKNGSPKHPLYCKSDSVLIPFRKEVSNA